MSLSSTVSPYEIGCSMEEVTKYLFDLKQCNFRLINAQGEYVDLDREVLSR